MTFMTQEYEQKWSFSNSHSQIKAIFSKIQRSQSDCSVSLLEEPVKCLIPQGCSSCLLCDCLCKTWIKRPGEFPGKCGWNLIFMYHLIIKIIINTTPIMYSYKLSFHMQFPVPSFHHFLFATHFPKIWLLLDSFY